LAHDRNQPPAVDFVLEVERLYAALIPAAIADSGSQALPGLGGQLLYAGDLNAEGSALVVAANIAGAASLASSADASASKQAVRDGVVDFLVTSLDEALRILKNQVRKCETVAVCVAASPQVVEQQMLERGVLPDLLPPCDASSPQYAEFVAQGSQHIDPSKSEKHQAVLRWSVAAAPARWLPKLDAIALECLSPGDWTARRWLQFSPRYLGRMAQGVRVMNCEPSAAKEFIAKVRLGVHRREIEVGVSIRMNGSEETILFEPQPPANSENAD
jgi:hypothetical protein